MAWPLALVALAAMPIATTGALPRGVSPPPAGALFSYQIGGAFPPGPGVRIVDRDRLARPVAGLYNICYVNAFQAQRDELRWWRGRHRALLLFRHGRPVVDEQWHEQLLDTSTPRKRAAIARVVGRWMAGCARAGFAAVEPDNLDSWERSEGALSPHDNLLLASLLARRAHALGLAIAQKNAAELSAAGHALGFDFAIAEECERYDECGAYMRAYGREVIEIEYPGARGMAGFRAACRTRGKLISIVFRDRDVTPRGSPGFVERHCSPADLAPR